MRTKEEIQTEIAPLKERIAADQLRCNELQAELDQATIVAWVVLQKGARSYLASMNESVGLIFQEITIECRVDEDGRQSFLASWSNPELMGGKTTRPLIDGVACRAPEYGITVTLFTEKQPAEAVFSALAAQEIGRQAGIEADRKRRADANAAR